MKRFVMLLVAFLFVLAIAPTAEARCHRLFGHGRLFHRHCGGCESGCMGGACPSHVGVPDVVQAPIPAEAPAPANAAIRPAPASQADPRAPQGVKGGVAVDSVPPPAK